MQHAAGRQPAAGASTVAAGLKEAQIVENRKDRIFQGAGLSQLELGLMMDQSVSDGQTENINLLICRLITDIIGPHKVAGI